LGKNEELRTKIEELEKMIGEMEEKQAALQEKMKDSEAKLTLKDASKKHVEQELNQANEKFQRQLNNMRNRERECMAMLTGVSAQLKIVEKLLQEEMQGKLQPAISCVVKYPENLELREYCNMISRDIRTITNDLQTFVKIKIQYSTSLEVGHKKSLETLERQMSEETRTRERIVKMQVQKAVDVEKISQAAERKKLMIKHEAVLDQIRADHDQLISERDRFHQVTLGQMKAKHAQEMENLQLMFTMEREKLRKDGSEETELLSKSHEKQTSALQSKENHDSSSMSLAKDSGNLHQYRSLLDKYIQKSKR